MCIRDRKYKVCAKEALQDCYGAKFQIELQDYISSKMGKELNMVKKDTVDYERNVKELKKKTLNDRCTYLSRQIAKSEEELQRKRRILDMAGVLEATEKDIDDIKTSTSNGFTVMREPDWLRIKPLLKSLNAMKAERKEPVSYTHLDVYKRQVSEGIGISSSFAMMFFIYFFPSLLKFSA